MSKSPILETETLEYWLTATAMTVPRPATWYLGLTKDDGAGGYVEVDNVIDDTAYVRQPITFADPVLNSGEALSNLAVNYSATVLGTGSGYDMIGCSIYDALSAGNELYNGTFLANQIIAGGEVISFAAGDIKATED